MRRGPAEERSTCFSSSKEIYWNLGPTGLGFRLKVRGGGGPPHPPLGGLLEVIVLIDFYPGTLIFVNLKWMQQPCITHWML